MTLRVPSKNYMYQMIVRQQKMESHIGCLLLTRLNRFVCYVNTQPHVRPSKNAPFFGAALMIQNIDPIHGAKYTPRTFAKGWKKMKHLIILLDS